VQRRTTHAGPLTLDRRPRDPSNVTFLGPGGPGCRGPWLHLPCPAPGQTAGRLYRTATVAPSDRQAARGGHPRVRGAALCCFYARLAVTPRVLFLSPCQARPRAGGMEPRLNWGLPVLSPSRTIIFQRPARRRCWPLAGAAGVMARRGRGPADPRPCGARAPTCSPGRSAHTGPPGLRPWTCSGRRQGGTADHLVPPHVKHGPGRALRRFVLQGCEASEFSTRQGLVSFRRGAIALNLTACTVGGRASSSFPSGTLFSLMTRRRAGVTPP